MNRTVSKVLVANRGEIALRVIRACRDLGIGTVLAVSEADRDSMPAREADRAVCIGPARPNGSYLKVDTIVTAALGAGCDAVHPGYGFLAEQPDLPETCETNGLVFIGPKADNIRRMGDKLYARRMVKTLGVPVIPGSDLVRDFKAAKRAAGRAEYPVLLKAAVGGGGKGMKIVRKAEDLKASFYEASAEALAAFGDGRVYIEHYIPDARHIEVQVLGDRFGKVVHLFERDCSVQRRYQKMIEEAPSPAVTEELRERMCRAALLIAGEMEYLSAGTVEFIFDQQEQNFYFLEMNTRIQVEHPVTEMITGVDLVREQIRIAAGLPVGFSQDEVARNGHAVECRINAELPDADFMPSPGIITQWEPPGGEGIRVDSHCYAGYEVPPYYDSLLAKLIVTGEDRDAAIQNMHRTLSRFVVSGVHTTIPFHRFVMEQDDYRSGRFNTSWIEDTVLERYNRR